MNVGSVCGVREWVSVWGEGEESVCGVREWVSVWGEGVGQCVG